MTGWIAVSLIWIFAAALAWRAVRPMFERKLALAERRVEIERMRVENERVSSVKPPISGGTPMPQDMIEWAMGEAFDWAREDKLSRMNELYGKLGDWEKVRRAVMQEEELSVKQTF